MCVECGHVPRPGDTVREVAGRVGVDALTRIDALTFYSGKLSTGSPCRAHAGRPAPAVRLTSRRFPPAPWTGGWRRPAAGSPLRRSPAPVTADHASHGGPRTGRPISGQSRPMTSGSSSASAIARVSASRKRRIGRSPPARPCRPPSAPDWRHCHTAHAGLHWRARSAAGQRHARPARVPHPAARRIATSRHMPYRDATAHRPDASTAIRDA